MIPLEVKLLTIPLTDIEIGERFRKDYGNIDQLKYSITKNGLITPIAVAVSKTLDLSEKSLKPYTLLAGGRRLEALTQLGWTTIPVRIYTGDLSELEYRSIELAENFDRKEMSYVEELAIKRQVHELQTQIHGVKHGKGEDATGWSQADTARLLKESPANLARDLKLASAIESHPELGLDKCKNKTEALALLNSKGSERPGRSEKKINSSPEREAPPSPPKSTDREYKRLCDAYIKGEYFKTSSQIPTSSMDFIEVDFPTTGEGTLAKEVFLEARRILRDGSWIICWGNLPLLETWARNVGFKVGGVGIWLKPNISPKDSPHHLTPCYESFMYCMKGNATLNKIGRGNVFDYPPTSAKDEGRPLPLLAEIFSTFCKAGSSAYFPFLGTGTPLLAAHACKLGAFGNGVDSDLREKYIKSVEKYLNL